MIENNRLTEEALIDQLRAQVKELNAELERHATDRVNQWRQVEGLRKDKERLEGEVRMWQAVARSAARIDAAMQKEGQS